MNLANQTTFLTFYGLLIDDVAAVGVGGESGKKQKEQIELTKDYSSNNQSKTFCCLIPL